MYTENFIFHLSVIIFLTFETYNAHEKVDERLIIQERTQEGIIKESRSEFMNKHSPKKGHVLFFHSLGTKSHINVARALVAGLLESGHSVTTGFYTQTHIKHANYTEILIKDE